VRDGQEIGVNGRARVVEHLGERGFPGPRVILVLGQHQLGAGLVADTVPHQTAECRVRGLDRVLHVVFQRFEGALAGTSGERRDD
jgi:hypothetical protein